MAIADDELVTWATAEHEKCSRHRNYSLSCDQFDELLDRAKGCCELCGADRLDSAWECLHIDHEHQVGQWAVRGLLCDACNRRLQRGRRLPDTVVLRSYLENAWYIGELSRLEVSTEMIPEPGLGSTVRAFGRSWMRLSVETAHGWVSNGPGNARGSYKSWHQLWYTYGPINIEVMELRDSIPSYAQLIYPMAYRVLVKTTQAPRSPTKGILQERIARALAITSGPGWHPEDKRRIDELVAILTGTPPEGTP